MPSTTTSDRLASLAQDQWGLLTRRQAQLAGIPATTLDRLTADPAVLERVAHGVYRLAGSPQPNNVELRAAWMQLAPAIPIWERTEKDGVVSHRSAAALYRLGELPADRHDFTLPSRRQTRRADVKFHIGRLNSAEWIRLSGILVTRPSRIAVDLIKEREDSEAVARLVAEAIRDAFDYPGAFAQELNYLSGRFGMPHGDGVVLLQWLLDLIDDRDKRRWLDEARESLHGWRDPRRAGSAIRDAQQTT